jgi:type VI secretion system secreted protein Hcp
MKDIYVEFKGSDIKGDSRDAKHKDTVEVYSWSHTMRQPKSATASAAGGHTAERVEHGEMMFTKDIDGASPKLYQACSSGLVVSDVIIYFYRPRRSQQHRQSIRHPEPPSVPEDRS